MATFDVTLPINKTVVFPPRCVVCEKPNPDGTIKLSILGANSSSTLDMAVQTGVFDNIDSKSSGSNTLNKIDGIPSCKGCAFGLKWYHRLLKFGIYTGWIPGFALFMLLPLPLVVRIIIFIPFLVAAGVLSIIFPPSFGATFFNNQANFEFKSKLVAEEFLALNSDATLKSAEPKTQTNAASLNDAGKSD